MVSPGTRNSIGFSFYGFNVRMTASDPVRLSDIAVDFSYFRTSVPVKTQTPDLEIHFYDSASRPPMPRLPAAQHTPRNVVFRDKEISYLDYGGRALARISEKGKKIEVYSDDRHLAHEAAYLTILSYTGQYFDRTGRTRVHALGLETGG